MAKAHRARAGFSFVLLLALPWRASAAPTELPLSAFRAQISVAERLVSACADKPAACNAESLPAGAQVRGENGVPGFHADWQWMRDVLDKAAKASPTERAALMRAADAHLAEMSAQTSAAAGTSAAARTSAVAANLPAAHAAVARVLAGDEFLADAGPTWLDRQLARLQNWFLRIFSGMGWVGARNPWIAPLIEWTFFGLACAGLLFFVRRSLARQALRISLAGPALAHSPAALSSADWLRRAAEAKAAGKARETMHCLYWAAIASLEARKAWSPNPTRTPREYVRLLRPGSGTQHALRDLTRRFERSWYGSAEPTAAEIQSAKQDLETIQTSPLPRGSDRSTENSSENNVAARPPVASPIPPAPSTPWGTSG